VLTKAFEIAGVAEQGLIVLEPDELGRDAERILQQKALPDRLAGRPVEEHDGDGELRQQQQGRHREPVEIGVLLHGLSERIRRPGSRGGGVT